MSQQIRNMEMYIEELNDSASNRYQINELKGDTLKLVNRIFKLSFNKASKDLVLVKNMLYYKGGYPSESSPAKLAKIFEDLTKILCYFKYLNSMDIIDEYLNIFGIKITFNDDIISNFYNDMDFPIDELSKKKKEKIKNLYNSLFSPDNENEIFSLSKRKLLNKLLDVSLEKQGIICSLSDNIRLEKAPIIEEECDIIKSSFLKAVELKAKLVKDGDITEDLQKLISKQDNLEAALEPLK